MTLTVRTENSMRGNVTCENNTHQAYRKSKLKKDFLYYYYYFLLETKKEKEVLFTHG